MSKFKIAFFMMAAMICIAATSWGDDLGNSMSLNNKNYFIVVNSDPNLGNGDISFIAGKINPDKKPAQIEFFSESKVTKSGWGSEPTISLNDNNEFVESNIGMKSNQIYYNAGKINPDTGEITFTDTGVTFTNNEGKNPNITLNNYGQFLEVHEGEGGTRTIKTNKFPFFKRIPVKDMYFVSGWIDPQTGKIQTDTLGTGKYCHYGELPTIAALDPDSMWSMAGGDFLEVHMGPDDSKPYAIWGSMSFPIENKQYLWGGWNSNAGEGILINDYDKFKTILAIELNHDTSTGKDHVNVITTIDPGPFPYQRTWISICQGTMEKGGLNLNWPDSGGQDFMVNNMDISYGSANNKYFVGGSGYGTDDIGDPSNFVVLPYTSSRN